MDYRCFCMSLKLLKYFCWIIYPDFDIHLREVFTIEISVKLWKLCLSLFIRFFAYLFVSMILPPSLSKTLSLIMRDSALVGQRMADFDNSSAFPGLIVFPNISVTRSSVFDKQICSGSVMLPLQSVGCLPSPISSSHLKFCSVIVNRYFNLKDEMRWD